MKRIVLVLTAFMLTWGGAPSAQAHTELVSTSPMADAQIAAPRPIALTFTEAPIIEGSAIVLADSNGTQYTAAPLTLEGATLVGGWPSDLPVGYTKVSWRAVADDGHVVTGEYNFYYSAAAAEQSVITGGAKPTETESGIPMPRYYQSKAFLPTVLAGALIVLALLFILRNRRNK